MNEWMNEWQKLVTRAAVEQVESEVHSLASQYYAVYCVKIRSVMENCIEFMPTLWKMWTGLIAV